jgi:dipeptidyl aminopeptidase/acylaminoacyl peptidase
MKLLITPSFLLIALLSFGQEAQKRKLQPGDIYKMKTVSNPVVSPEGQWVAYTVTSVDSAKDKSNSDVWMVSLDGQTIQLTNSPDGESSPQWSPDGKYLSFVSSRFGLKKSQIWLMDRKGGEAKKLTDLKADLTDYKWSPDGKKLVLVVRDLPDTSKTKTHKPIEIDRYRFKQDVQGYVQERYTHLYLFEIDTKKLDTLTRGKFNEAQPEWSPDGGQIVFVSNRTAEPDKNNNTDLWIIDAKPGAVPRQLTTWTGSDVNPKWSPDGKLIASLRSTSPSYNMYDQNVLAVIPALGGETKLLTQALDRPVSNPVWSSDNKSISVLVADDRQQYIGEASVATHQFKRVVEGNRVFSSISVTSAGTYIGLMSDPQRPAEVCLIENGEPRRLTSHHEEFFATLQLASVEGFTSKSKDGTAVSNILYRAVGVDANQKNPTLFFIHGGPVSQDSWGFAITQQILAAAGYHVVSVNYRGSSGRGLAYSRAISADWGNKEVIDIHGAVDYIVAQGIADPGKLGIGGWSYGGMLTNYSIATDTRFKAAVSGAGIANILSGYGHDQYINQYENELGLPWKNIDKYMKISYPFFKADRIKTPTLYIVGEKDFNVPAIGSEQMYQALRAQNIPTGLIIYPGQFHGISTPSYQVDRLNRYIKWYDTHLKGLPSVKIDKEMK